MENGENNQSPIVGQTPTATQVPQVNQPQVVNQAPVAAQMVQPAPTINNNIPVAQPVSSPAEPTLSVPNTIQASAPAAPVPTLNVQNTVQAPVTAEIAPTLSVPNAVQTPDPAEIAAGPVAVPVNNVVALPTNRTTTVTGSSTEGQNAVAQANQYQDSNKDNRLRANAPFFIVILITVFAVAGAIVYIVGIPPKKVFNKAVEDMKVLYAVPIEKFIDTKREKMVVTVGFSVDTDQTQFEKSTELEPVDYIDNDFIQGKIFLDLKNNDYKVNLMVEKNKDNLKKLNILEGNSKEDAKMLDFDFYNVNNKIYIGPIDYINYNNLEDFGKERIVFDKSVQMDLIEALMDEKYDFSISKEKMYDLERFIAISIDKAVDIIDEKEVKRKIVRKNIGGDSKLLFKSILELDNKRLNEIYHKILSDYYNGNEETFVNSNGEKEKVRALKLLTNITGLSEEKIKNKLKEMLDENLESDHVLINLYNSISARVSMGAIEVYIDDKYYYEAEVADNFFRFDMGIVENRGELNEKYTARMQVLSDMSEGSVDGTFYLDNDNTKLIVTFDFDLIENSKGENIGNTLVLKFYNNDTYKSEKKKPFAVLDCKVEYYDNIDNEDKVNFDLKKEVENAYALPDIKINGMPKTSVEGLERINISEATSLLKFEKNFTSHIEYLINHLLYNKDGAIERKNKEKESNNTNAQNENNTEEVIIEENKKSDNIEEANSETVEKES